VTDVPPAADDRGDGGDARSDSTGEGRSLTPPPRMTLGRTAAWGLVGALTFLVLHQAYLLAGGQFLGFAPVTAVALVVGAGVAGTARWLAARTSGNGQR